MASERDLDKTAAELAALLEKLRAAGGKKARVEDQQEAFRLGCDLLTRLVDLIERSGALRDLEKATAGFAIGIPASGLKDFLQQELAWLEKRLRLSKEDLRDVKQNLDALASEDQLGDLRLDSAQVIAGLQQFRDILCNINVLLKNGIEINPALVKACFAGAIDVCQIAGDVLVIAAGAATGNLPYVIGTWLLAAGSVGAGIQGLLKRLEKLGTLFRSEKARIEKELAARKSAAAIQEKLRRSAPKKKL